MLPVPLAGTTAYLLPSGAAYLPAWRTLLIADAHFGKAVSFRKLGVPVPEATTAATLAALDADLARTQASQIVFLGDFLHSARSHAPATLAALTAWRQRNLQIDLTLVRGNHDDRAGDPPTAMGLRVVDEPLPLGPFALCHHPRPVAGAYVLAGHLHPCMSLHGRGWERLRLPCFWLGDDSGARPSQRVGVLPAYGSFTGMHRIEPHTGDRVYGIAGDTVRALPLPGR